MATSGTSGLVISARSATARSPVTAASMVSCSYALACWTSARISGARGAVGMGVAPLRSMRAGSSTTASSRQVRHGALVAHVDDLDVARPGMERGDELGGGLAVVRAATLAQQVG